MEISMSAQALGWFGTVLAAMVYTFQSRHHGLYEHQRILSEKIRDLSRVCPDSNATSSADGSLNDYLNEVTWVRLRYWFALAAYGLMMLQIAIVLISLSMVSAKNLGLHETGFGVLFWLWLPALICNIFGDIGLAIFNQLAIHRQLPITTRKDLVNKP